MKIKLLFLIIFLSGLNCSFSQNSIKENYTSVEQSAGEKPENDNYASSGQIMQRFSLKFDFDNDGTNEVFSGIMLKKIDKHLYWVKNASILNSDNEIVADFGKKIIVNGKEFIGQINAVNGYIVEIKKNNKKNELFVSIAGENGEKNSDELLININNMK